MSRTMYEEAKLYSKELALTGRIVDQCILFALSHIDHFMDYSQKQGHLAEGESTQNIIGDIRLARQNMQLVIAASRVSLSMEMERMNGESTKVKKEKDGKKAS
jgi:hypothetical protein